MSRFDKWSIMRPRPSASRPTIVGAAIERPVVANPVPFTFASAFLSAFSWAVDQAEVATDIAFTSRLALEAASPASWRTPLPPSGRRMCCFLGRRLHPALAGEVTSDARRRPEG
jgi:hypothetical protein